VNWTLDWGRSFSATSGASYGSSGCEQRFIVDMKNASSFAGRVVEATFPSPPTQAQCVDTGNNNAPLARVTLTTYVDGTKVSTVGPIYPHWNTGGGLGAYCDWGVTCTRGFCPGNNTIAIPSGRDNVRVVVKLERNNYHPEKQARLWELAPVTVKFFAVR
jgi:hypothetical protein